MHVDGEDLQDMTMELLERIIKDYCIPKDVHLLSDSGWETDLTSIRYGNREI